MKEIILKNKKILSIVLVAVTIIFLVLIALNLTGTKRDAYQSMYDANEAMYDSYIDIANKYSSYGYSSQSQNYYSKAENIKYKMDDYGDEISALNLQLAIYAILAIGSSICVVLLLKVKNKFEPLAIQEVQEISKNADNEVPQ